MFFDLDDKKFTWINSLLIDEILEVTKLKAFAYNKLTLCRRTNFCICRRQYKCNLKTEILFLGLVENIVGKEENAGYQHFLLFPQCFQKVSLSGSLKVWIVW